MPQLISTDMPDIAAIRADVPKDKPEPVSQAGDIPDVAAAREAQVPEGYEDTPQMKAQDVDLLTQASDFIRDVGDQMKYNDSLSGLQNMWRSLFDKVKQAVPEYDEQGQFLGTRYETDEEHKARLQQQTEANRKRLHDNLAAEITAKGTQIVMDPTTWLPVGQTYRATAGISSGIAAFDMAAYQLAEEGEIDPKDVGIAAAFGAVLGPAIKYVGGKVVDTYKDLVSKGVPHEEAMQQALPSPEALKALPAPQPKLEAPQEVVKALPAPTKTDAPIFITRKGKPVATPVTGTGETRIVEGKGKFTGREAEIEDMWQEKALREWQAKEHSIDQAWQQSPSGVTPAKIKSAVKAERAARASEGEVVSDAVHPNSAMLDAFDQATRRQEEGVSKLQNHMNQGGQVSEALMHHLATTSIGAGIGGYVDGPEGAIVGGMLGMGAPLAFRHMRKGIGKMSDWANDDAASVMAHARLWSAPTAVLKGFGTAGRHLAERIGRMHENIDLKVAEKLWEFEKQMGHLSKTEMSQMRKVLAHTMSPSQVSAKVLAAAKQMRREFNAVLDDAVKAGVLTAKEVAKMKAKTMKSGYFPRIYDKDYLATKAGKQAWVDAWTKFTGGKKDLQEALESIVGDKDIVASVIKNAMKNAKGEYYLSQGNALNLLRLMQNKSQHARSSHLEKSRAISEKAEAILEPFLIQDPSAVIARYFNDAYRRIEAARIFDGVDSKGNLIQDYFADASFNKIAQEFSPQQAKIARDIYYTSVGDANSSVIKQAMDLGDRERRVLQGMSSFQTATKLSTAQMLNSIQATVNGMTRLNNLTANPLKSFQLWGKGLIKSLGPEGGEFAQRTGAALETTMMEIAGEASHLGKWGERVLKYSGFIAAEKIQRRLGANIGRAYAEDLLAKWAKVQKGQIKGNKAKKIQKQLAEMGIPTHRTPTDTDMYRAGLRFSNEINFRNTPDKLPLAWQTPYGRMFTKFKSFAFHQTRFVKDNVIKPLLRGNPYPLIWYAGGAGSIGMGVDELRRIVKGDDREFTETERYLRGLTSIGGIGLMQDLLTSGATKTGGLAAAITGPAISDIGRTLMAGKKLIVDQDPQKALDDVQRMFVLPGKGYIIQDIANEGSSRGSGRSGGRSLGRSGGR